jgi:hypothetical protein
MSQLQSKINRAEVNGVIDLRGQEFLVDETVFVHKRATILGGLLYASNDFPGGPMLHINAPGTVVEDIRVKGRGRSKEQDIGIKVTAEDVTLSRCHVEDVEYILYFFDMGSDGSRMSHCSGKQLLSSFPYPWKGYDYGVVTQYTSDILITGCNILATRHAVIFGHGTKNSTIDSCFLKNTGNVQTVAMKPLYNGNPFAKNCRVVDSDILGGVNLGGESMTLSGNHIVGRLEHRQTSSVIWAPRDTITNYNHTIIGNVFRTGTVYPGSKQMGAIYMSGSPGRWT